MKMKTMDGAPIKLFKAKQDWAAWLENNHRESTGLWLRLAKKDSGLQSVSYKEALDLALCYGWIDGQKRPEDEKTWLQRFTARSSKSLWSKINREKALALIAAGEMKAAGLMMRQALQLCRATFRLRWMRMRGPRRSLKLSTERTGMRSFGEFRQRRNQRLALGRLSSSLECWRRERKFIPDLFT